MFQIIIYDFKAGSPQVYLRLAFAVEISLKKNIARFWAWPKLLHIIEIHINALFNAFRVLLRLTFAVELGGR